MVPRPADVIADALLAHAAKKGFVMSNLKLQKLLYYIQGHHLARTGGVAFADAIKAWSHGPVVPAIYHRFKKYSWHDIEVIPRAPDLPDKVKETVELVWRKYGGFSGVELEDMTHAESPWLEARKGLAIGAPASPVISSASLRKHFAAIPLG